MGDAARIYRHRRYIPGDVIVAAGAGDRSLYLVLEGQLEVLAERGRAPGGAAAAAGQARPHRSSPGPVSWKVKTCRPMRRLQPGGSGTGSVPIRVHSSAPGG